MTAARLAKLREMLATPESRARLAAAMTSPGRCGGLDYVDGVPMYAHEKRAQGKPPA